MNFEHLLLFGTLYLASFMLLRNMPDYLNKKFWSCTWIFVTLYTIIVGCRYGWGSDYLSYEFLYNNQTEYKEGTDYGYFLFNTFERRIGLPFWFHIMLCAFFYIYSSLYLVKKTGVPTAWMVTLFLPMTIMFSTYAIRQSLALSFIYIYIGFVIFDKKLIIYSFKKIAVSILLIWLGYIIHSASPAFIIPFLLFLFLKNVKAFNYKIVIFVYLVVIIFINTFSDFFNDLLSRYIPMLSFNNHLQSYIDQSEKWFGEEAENASLGHSGIYLYFSYLSNLAVLYFSGKVLKKTKANNVAIMYNIFVLALIIRELFYTQEIMRRIIDPFVALGFIPLGYGVWYIFSNIKTSKTKWLDYTALVFGLLGIYYPQFKFLISFPLADFIWNH